jgi:transcriptional regulator with XRE-family HTH domain
MNIHATGDNIKHLCKRKGLTLGILADRIGVSDCTMSNWINGHRQVTAYGLLRISRVLGVTMEKLMEGVEDDN